MGISLDQKPDEQPPVPATSQKIVARRIVIAAIAALVAAGLTFGLTRYLGKPNKTSVDGRTAPTSAPPIGSTTSAPTSSSATTAGTCAFKIGEPGVIPVNAQAGSPPGLTFCPALLNNGNPLTGPFTVAGRFLGPVELYRDLIIVNQADQGTCDALGNKPAPGFYYARGMSIGADGTWSFRDPLGYDEAITIGRNYEIIKASAASIDAIKNDREKQGNGSDYAGMLTLPADARAVATFRQPPGKYHGKGSPCKNS